MQDFFKCKYNIKTCSYTISTLYQIINFNVSTCKYIVLKGIVHFEIKFWYVLAYLKGIQDVGVIFYAVVSILIFLGQTVLVCRSYNAGLWSLSQSMHRVQIKTIPHRKYTLMA